MPLKDSSPSERRDDQAMLLSAFDWVLLRIHPHGREAVQTAGNHSGMEGGGRGDLRACDPIM